MWIFVLRKIYSNTFTFLLLRNLCSEVLGYFYYSKPWDSLRQLSRHLATACWQAPGQRSLGQTVTQPCQWCAPKITMWPRATAQYSWLNLCSVFGFRKVKTKSAWAWQGCRSQKIRCFFFLVKLTLYIGTWNPPRERTESWVGRDVGGGWGELGEGKNDQNILYKNLNKKENK